jgi:hypothetical protein
VATVRGDRASTINTASNGCLSVWLLTLPIASFPLDTACQGHKREGCREQQLIIAQARYLDVVESEPVEELEGNLLVDHVVLSQEQA